MEAEHVEHLEVKYFARRERKREREREREGGGGSDSVTTQVVYLSMAFLCDAWTVQGKYDRQTQVYLYHFYCLLHVSALINSHNQTIKIQKRKIDTLKWVF